MKQLGEHTISFTVERREEEDKHTEQQSAHTHTKPRIGELGEESFHLVGGPKEIDRYQCTENAKNHIEGQLREAKLLSKEP